MPGLHQKEKEQLKRILIRAGYAQSDDMLTILDTFLTTENHQTLSDLKRNLKVRGLFFKDQEIQRALDLFCKYGFAHAPRFNDHEIKYEHRHLGEHHDHLICIRCGKIEEFVNPEMEDLQLRLTHDKGFIPLRHSMEIYGLCEKCSRQRGPAVRLSQAEAGERVVILHYNGGREMERRLVDMGLTRGTEVEVLSQNEGPLVVSCRGSRLALGKGLSEKIMVIPSRQASDGKSNK
ncbi:MAG: transcriptional repressor [Deltaproteobacteria bacterium]|nr:transcriptional repressor [Deltaproteobacteria bacterium]